MGDFLPPSSNSTPFLLLLFLIFRSWSIVTSRRLLCAMIFAEFYKDLAGAVLTAVALSQLWGIYERNDLRLIKEANERGEQKSRRLREKTQQLAAKIRADRSLESQFTARVGSGGAELSRGMHAQER